MKHSSRLVVPILLLGGILAACAGNSPIDVGETVAPTPVSFSGAVVPVFESGTSPSCAGAGCHEGPTPGATVLALGGGGMTDQQIYDDIMAGGAAGAVLDTANVAQSLLLTKPDSGSGAVSHAGGKIWTSSDPAYRTVRQWIEEGAQNN